MICIGNIKTTDIKTAAKELIDSDPSKFNINFEDNKKFIKDLKIIKDKSILNQMAGYVTRKMKIRSRKVSQKTMPQKDESS